MFIENILKEFFFRKKKRGGDYGSFFLQFHEQVRSQIEHEDSLINFRLTWFIIVNSFLIASYVGIFSYIDKVGENTTILILSAIDFVGFSSTFGAMTGIRAAQAAIQTIKNFYYNIGNKGEDVLFYLKVMNKNEIKNISYPEDLRNFWDSKGYLNFPPLIYQSFNSDGFGFTGSIINAFKFFWLFLQIVLIFKYIISIKDDIECLVNFKIEAFWLYKFSVLIIASLFFLYMIILFFVNIVKRPSKIILKLRKS